jgi:hypothetical protein
VALLNSVEHPECWHIYFLHGFSFVIRGPISRHVRHESGHWCNLPFFWCSFSPFHSLVVLHTLRGCTVTYCNKESNFLPKAKPAFIPVHFLRWRKNFGGAIFSSWAVFFGGAIFFFLRPPRLKWNILFRPRFMPSVLIAMVSIDN